MASAKAKTAMVLGVVLVLGGITYLTVKIRALAKLKEDNPVEYYVQHTRMTHDENLLRSDMLGRWQLAGTLSRDTGDFIFLQPGSNNYYFKTFAETNWVLAVYDSDSNVVFSAGGRYTLQGENYSEYIDAATGLMTPLLHSIQHFKIRVVGDKYYQMGSGKNPSVEEMWQRIDE